MIVIKNNGSILESLNIETIKDTIEKNNILAIVNRVLSYKENRVEIEGSDDYIENIYQDDITPEEIQEGMQAVKDYCLINNELELLKQYLPLVLSGEELLTEMKEVMFMVIRLKAEKLSRELLVDEVPDSEVATFTTQRSEAIAYRNSGYTNDNLCPMLKIIAEIRSMSLKDLVDKCLLKSSLYETEIAKILGKRQKLEDDIKKAQTLEELNLIVW